MKNIKAITTSVKEIGEKEFISEYIEYNNEGEITLSRKYDEGGNVIEKTLIEYDEEGKKIKEMQYSSEDNLEEEHYYYYNDDKKIKQEVIQYSEGYKSIKNFIRSDHEVKIEEVDENGETEEYKLIKFNENDLLSEEAEYDDRDKLTTASRYFYDDNKNLVRKEDYEEKLKKPINTKEYTYNEDNEIIGLIIKNRKGKVVDNYELLYDDEGRVIKQISPHSGIIEVQHTDNNTKKEIVSDAAGNIQNETEYHYNDSGHLVKQKTPMKEIRYDLEYY